MPVLDENQERDLTYLETLVAENASRDAEFHLRTNPPDRNTQYAGEQARQAYHHFQDTSRQLQQAEHWVATLADTPGLRMRLEARTEAHRTAAANWIALGTSYHERVRGLLNQRDAALHANLSTTETATGEAGGEKARVGIRRQSPLPDRFRLETSG